MLYGSVYRSHLFLWVKMTEKCTYTRVNTRAYTCRHFDVCIVCTKHKADITVPSCINNVMNVDRYRVGNDTQAVFDADVVLKDTALAEKERHKTTTPESTSVVTEDTEALLVAPKNNSSALYRTKLNCHNF